MIPTEPALPEDHPTHAALEAVRAELERSGDAELPPLEGVDGDVAARWLHRAWGLNGSGPFVLLRPERLGAELPEIDRGALVYLGPRPPRRSAGLGVRARSGHVRLLRAGAGDPLPLPRDLAARITALDAFTAVAADPDLELVRLSLIAHCRTASPVHLVGEAGTEAALLARWAHAVLDDRPLSHLRGDEGSAAPGQWALFEEVEELGAEAKQRLQELARAASPTPVRWVPPRTDVVVRPRHRAFASIVGTSPALAEVLREVLAVAGGTLPVLITGEPGVGKEALARAVHTASNRRGPFVGVDAGALSEQLAESTLFGHRRGAFTGADRDRAGAFRQADGGTLLLDEVGNLPPSLQVKLLRVLQERVVQPLGQDRPVPVDVRVVAATNADLPALVRAGRFRADLLGRLDAATLRLPPLRERIEDLEALAAHLARVEGAEASFSEAALRLLREHRWPGNVRELTNVVRYAVAVAPPGGPIEPDHLGPLSPRVRRAVPLITTSSDPDASPTDWGLDRRVVQTLTAATLRIPPLRERSLASRRRAVLEALDGRPITPSALDRLSEQPWWGNDAEVRGTLAVLRGLPPGSLDDDLLRRYLPHLATGGGQAPIRALLAPTRDAAGRVGGLTRDFASAALLVGRVGSFTELRGGAAAGDPTARARVDTILARCRGVEPACLDLGMLPRLSRAHVLVTRDGDGLQVETLPGAGLAVHARGFDAPSPSPATAPTSIGRAGEVIVGSPAAPYLRLHLFAGAVAFDEHAEDALAAAQRTDGAGATVQRTLARAVPPPPSPEPPRAGAALHVWMLQAAEVEALTDVVASFLGGSFKGHVVRRIGDLRERGELARLVEYVERAPRLSQYLVRLYEYEPNEALRERLAGRIAASPDPAARLALLPRGIGRAVSAR